MSALAGPAGPDRAETATPDGYHLWHPGYRRSNGYRYDSDTDYHYDYRCSTSGCVLRGEAKAALQVNVTGHARESYPLHYGAIYYCGVNVPDADDHICGNGAHPINVGVEVNPDYVENAKSFEHVNNNVVFPMVSVSTLFSSGGVAVSLFRGWDVLNRATTTILAPNSDDGS